MPGKTRIDAALRAMAVNDVGRKRLEVVQVFRDQLYLDLPPQRAGQIDPRRRQRHIGFRQGDGIADQQ